MNVSSFFALISIFCSPILSGLVSLENGAGWFSVVFVVLGLLIGISVAWSIFFIERKATAVASNGIAILVVIYPLAIVLISNIAVCLFSLKACKVLFAAIG